MINEYTVILATILILIIVSMQISLAVEKEIQNQKCLNVVRIPTERFKKIYLYFSVNSRISDSREERNERYFLVGSKL